MIVRAIKEKHLRQTIQSKARQGIAIGSNWIVHDFGWVKREEWCPGDGVKPLEEKHDGNVAINKALGCAGLVIRIYFG